VKEEEPVETPLKEFHVSPKDLESLLSSGEVKEILLEDAQESLKLRVFGYNKSAMEIPKKTYTKWLDYDKIKQGFSIRVRQEGDYFVNDIQGHRKKLQNYFVDEKIPMGERNKMWLLAQDSYVLWLVGGRISENAKVTENTQVIVELEYIGGREDGFYKEA
jgi:tRNA(Ile)-lysidine synthase